ncbi:carbohydrate kinase family protein [Methylomonas methanica]|uniref:PfkB domain protein n=1 Tax=Methylomonas methanica (strain DSM 25384 / MC09) TaxID=857087 RepID=F9ZX42_METMM|nr:carbohydrate kinase family protein [Methylomonas methanica]AEF98503.1 PfkB domain protein [Methylomonas methanica MC09]
MSRPADIAVCGEIMLESTLPMILDQLPEADRTLIIDGVSLRTGGPSFNISRQLLDLGEKPRLVSFVGNGSYSLIESACVEAGLDQGEIRKVEGAIDFLFTIHFNDGFRSFYQRNFLEINQAEQLVASATTSAIVILAGSRQPALRQAYCRASQTYAGDFLVFSPNYALFDFGKEEILTLCQHAGLIAVNEREARYLCDVIGVEDDTKLASTVPGMLLVTRRERGADLFVAGEKLTVPALSASSDDVFGSGDTFLAAFLRAHSKGAPLLDALIFAAAAAAVFIDTDETWPRITVSMVEAKLKTIDEEAVFK